MKMLVKSATVFALLSQSACQVTTLNTETTKALCNSWYDSLFLPSRSDTHQTAVMLTEQAKIQAAACNPRGL